MMIASATTFIAVALVLGVIGYRVFHAGGSAPPVTGTDVALPAGAKVVSTTVADGRIVVIIELPGATELRLFDLATLKPLGTVRLAPKP